METTAATYKALFADVSFSDVLTQAMVPTAEKLRRMQALVDEAAQKAAADAGELCSGRAGRTAALLTRIGLQRVMRGLVVASLVAGAEAREDNAYGKLDVFFLVADTLGVLFTCGLLATLLMWMISWCSNKFRRCSGKLAPASFQQHLLETMTCIELREALRHRKLRVSGLKAALIERLVQSPMGLTEEACAALVFVSRRTRSKPTGSALQDDAGAWAWILTACEKKH